MWRAKASTFWAFLLVGTALLSFGLYRWPPEVRPYTSPRRSVGQTRSGTDEPDFVPASARNKALAVLDYGAATGILWIGWIWSCRSFIKGCRPCDLYRKRWAGGRGLWFLYHGYLMVTGYATLICLSLIYSAFSSA
jgi:hypothetical protein